MSRSKRNRDLDKAEAGIKAVLAIIFLLALAGGGIHGLGERVVGLIVLVALAAICLASLVGIYYVVSRTNWSGQKTQTQSKSAGSPTVRTAKQFEWNAGTIREKLKRIDWYQFEKFCAALLKAEGYSVERKGGAHPDGGVDLIACKFDGNDTLVQCKQWRGREIPIRVVREMLGSMTDFGVHRGAIYTLKGWTRPSAEFAEKHNIHMVSGADLAARAERVLTVNQLEQILNESIRRCPRCEAPMVLRKGNFDPFWGCSTYPRCRGTIQIS